MVSTRHVSFILGDGSYCVPVDQVVQILRNENVLQIPKAPSFVEGVVNLRGDVIPVIDLRRRLGLAVDETGRRRRIVVVSLGKRCYGLLVDEVREIVELEEGTAAEDTATLFGARAEFIRAIGRRGEALFLHLDLQRVLAVGGAEQDPRVPGGGLLSGAGDEAGSQETQGRGEGAEGGG